MGKVILHTTLSLDGFMASSDDNIDWAFKYGGPDEMIDEMMNTTGAVVLGNRTFEGTIRENALPYGGALKIPQFVVTHQAREPRTIDGLRFIFVTKGVERAVELAKTAAGEKNVSLLGASIDQQCLKAGLVDEIVLHVAPILLGEGVRLFDHLGNEPIELERAGIVSQTGITSLRFSVIKTHRMRNLI